MFHSAFPAIFPKSPRLPFQKDFWEEKAAVQSATLAWAQRTPNNATLFLAGLENGAQAASRVCPVPVETTCSDGLTVCFGGPWLAFLSGEKIDQSEVFLMGDDNPDGVKSVLLSSEKSVCVKSLGNSVERNGSCETGGAACSLSG